jgi:hypothetical protein
MNSNTDRLWQAWVWAERAFRDEWLKVTRYKADAVWEAEGVSPGKIPPEPLEFTREAGRELNRLRDEAKDAQARYENAIAED